MPANTTASSRKKKKGRRARLLVIVLVLAVLAGLGYGAWWSVSTVRASFPQTTGTIKIEGLKGDVEVKRDDYGIPQIYADTDEDLFRAQGFVQAQDRFWEMDVRRHMTAGRLSEMFGSGQVDTDAFLRTLGWRQVAQEEYDKKLSAETKKYLQAYAEGVNAYLKGKEGKDLSVEYAALALTNEYKPEPWTPVDSVAWLKAMAWDLRGNMQEEVDRSLLTSRLSEKQIKELYPPYPYDRNKPIVENGAVDESTGEFDPDAEPSGRNGGGNSGVGSDLANSNSNSGSNGSDAAGAGSSASDAAQGLNSQLAALSETLDTIPALLGPNGNGIGSNSWVVHGKYTTTDKPLLANDPHLAPQLPSLWYQMGLRCRTVSSTCQFDTAGYTFSGMPGVIIGHNQDIAWGFTNLGADVTDLYLEKLSGNSYQVGGESKELKTREEVIKVAGGASKTITVRSTDHGPLVSDRSSELEKVGQKARVSANSAPDRATGYAVSLQWTALQPGKSMDAVFDLNRAKDFASFRKAARNFEVPSQNLVYADAKGNIGYQAPGKVPIRAKGDGSVPAPGWDPKYRWEGYIPFDEMPYEENPERGYIVTANQAVISEKYKYSLTSDYGYGTRSQRINDVIESKIKDGGKISTEDMRTMQMDNTSEIAKELTPHLLKIDVSDPYVREAQKLLEGWDYSQEPDSAAAAYFNGVWRNILKLAFGNKLPKELRVEGECLSVRPADSTAPDDELSRRIIECGMRDEDSAQPDGGDRWFEVVLGILDDEDNPWWQSPASRTDAQTTTRDQLFARAMEDARWELTAEMGKDVSSWSWGRLHQLTLRNQTLGTEGPGFLQYLLNRGPWNLGGGEATVNATGWNAAAGYEAVWVPSMRMVVNVGDWDRSRWINLTGASGHAYSAHYTDQTDKWAKGELLDWSFSSEAVEANTVDTLTLTP
ncbi:penicillin acylase family protein [Streptomyces sp. NPDC004838]